MRTLPRSLSLAALVCTFAGCDKPQPESALSQKAPAVAAAVHSATTPASSTPNSFQEVAAQLDPGGSFYMYLSTQQWLAGLSREMEQSRSKIATLANQMSGATSGGMEPTVGILADLLAKSGLEAATGVGISSLEIAPGLHRSKFFLHHAPGTGKGFVWSLFGEKAHKLDSLQLLPTETAAAAFSDFNPAALVSFVSSQIDQLGQPALKASYEQALDQLTSILGMPINEALQTMRGNAGFIVTLDPTKPIKPPGNEGEDYPTPAFALLLPASDERVFNQLDKTFGTNPQMVRVDEAGLKMRTLPDVPTPFGVNLRPTVALWGGYIISATNDQLVRDIVAAKGGKGLKDQPGFQDLTKDLPTEGNGFQLATKVFSTTMSRLQVEMMKNQPAASSAQPKLMQYLSSQNAGSESFSVTSHLENGLLVTSHRRNAPGQAKSLANLLASVFGAMDTTATTPIPADLSSDSSAHAKKIYDACVRYAADNAGNFPPNLQALVPRYLPAAESLVSPYSPETEIGYTYVPGLNQDSPAKSLLIEDNQALAKQKRITVQVDGSITVADVPSNAR